MVRLHNPVTGAYHDVETESVAEMYRSRGWDDVVPDAGGFDPEDPGVRDRTGQPQPDGEVPEGDDPDEAV